MTKKDIAERIQTNTDLSIQNSLITLELLLNIMKDTLETGEKITISGFGNFEVKQKKDRRGRNPQTGASVTIEARRILTFKPSAVLRNAINNHRAE